MVALLVMVLAFLLCWRLLTGGWKGFDAFIISRFERLARTKLIRTALSLALFAIMATSSPVIAVILAPRMEPSTSYGILWGSFATEVAINLALVLTMVFLAHRGLRKMSPG